MIEYLNAKWQDLKAWRRGERRASPGRGRVYERKDGGRQELEPAQLPLSAKITAKVIRADGSTEYHEAHNVRVEHGDGSHDSRP